jgi:hypothetical protein
MNRNGEGDGRDHGWLECDVSVLITASSFLTLVCASVGVAVAGRLAADSAAKRSSYERSLSGASASRRAAFLDPER